MAVPLAGTAGGTTLPTGLNPGQATTFPGVPPGANTVAPKNIQNEKKLCTLTALTFALTCPALAPVWVRKLQLLTKTFPVVVVARSYLPAPAVAPLPLKVHP